MHNLVENKGLPLRNKALILGSVWVMLKKLIPKLSDLFMKSFVRI